MPRSQGALGALNGHREGLIGKRLIWGVFDRFSQEKWSERQDLNLRRLAPKASALARLSYAPARLYIVRNRPGRNSKVIKNQFANRHPNLQNTGSINV